MTQFALWLIDEDAIICSTDGMPVLFYLDKLPKGAVHLSFVETHNQVSHSLSAMPVHEDSDFPTATHALSVLDAISAGLIHRHGEGFVARDIASLSAISFRHLAVNLSRSSAEHISRAVQLLRWQADHRYCSRCGTPAKIHPHGEHAMICPACRHRAYPRVQPCIITAITRLHPATGAPQILLALHHRHKDTGMYGLIAGFIEAGESAEMAVRREVAEEVGLSVADIQYLHSQPWPYPSNLMLGFMARYDGGEINCEPNELAEAKFFDLDKLPKTPQAGTIAYDLIQAVINQYA